MFEAELAHFDKNLNDLLLHYENQFVVVKGSEVLAGFGTEQEAFEAGLSKFGVVSFLVKRVVREEKPIWIPVLNLGFRK